MAEEFLFHIYPGGKWTLDPRVVEMNEADGIHPIKETNDPERVIRMCPEAADIRPRLEALEGILVSSQGVVV